ALAVNGDDAVELFQTNEGIDVFGEIDVDGSGEPWEYADGWAYRNNGTSADASTFRIENWRFSGANALDGETTNATAATPFPIGSFDSCSLPEQVPDILLSEIVVTPTAGEFIEIHNPTAAAIDLSNIYVTDATFAGGNVFYYNIVTGGALDAGGGGFGDFHARFPDGASIAPGEFQTIAIAGSDDFATAYGMMPTYELFEDATDGPDTIADMREALPGSINGQGGLTNGGEVVILYTWDGESDLVEDIDYAVWGDKAEAVAKNPGIGIDGPDADSVDSFYLADTAIADQDVVATDAHSSGESFQRADFAEGIEIQSGGNGITGSDETSENVATTWVSRDVSPGTEFAPPPPPPPVDANLVINEISADPDAALGDANGDGTVNTTQDEFVEIVNVGDADVDVSGWSLSDGFGVRHVFPTGSVIEAGCSALVFGGGEPAEDAFGSVLVQTASGGSLGLNNGGDTVTLNDGTSDVASVSYGGEGGDNQSLTRDPDIDGAGFVQHTAASGADGALSSPGTRVDGSSFAGCTPPPPPPSPWVINEIHADPASDLPGDANGDGVRDFSDDEFIEIVNNTGDDVDISGWTLADGASTRHVFPANSLVYNGCSVVVFGGGTPGGAFGNALVQVASSGALGLNNGGDTVTLSDGVEIISTTGYGGEGGDNQSLTLDPDVTGTEPRVRHSTAMGSGGALFSPGTASDGMPFIGCPVAASINDVQGFGGDSPLRDSRVIVVGTVTALSTNGFFIQTAGDGDPATSDGVFVFTGDTPNVDVGQEVEVNGVVDEFFGLTQITGGPEVTVLGDGMLPAAIVFDSMTPSPDPAAPSCPGGGLECFEGMLVEVPIAVVTQSNQTFGSDPIAEVFFAAGVDRPFREPGIEFPGIPSLPSIPVWDGNPEIFELDPDKLGLENRIIPAGSTFSARGVIGFDFGDYELWPSELTVHEAPLPQPVRRKTRDEATIATFNLFRLFNDIDDPSDIDINGRVRNDAVVSPDEYALRRAKAAAFIVDVMRSPDIIAVQEVESLEVLEDLAATVRMFDWRSRYKAYLVEGNDLGTIDVGFLVKRRIKVKSVTQLGKDELLSVDGSPLHDRPPLLLDAIINEDLRVKVLALHMRSLGGIEETRNQIKRLEQAQSVGRMINDIQRKRKVKLAVVGDFNAFEFPDGYVDLAGVIQGDFDAAESLVCTVAACDDVVERDLVNEILNAPEEERYSFVFNASAQILDQVMTSRKLSKLVTDIEFARGNADAARLLVEDDGTLADLAVRASDHDGIVLYVCKDDDDCFDDDDDDEERKRILLQKLIKLWFSRRFGH
ncbi:MAG: lamin tail domain-containing protein, partial [Pseudomonadota bacterium]